MAASNGLSSRPRERLSPGSDVVFGVQSLTDPGTEHLLGSQRRPAGGGSDDVSDALELPIGLIWP